MGTIRIWVNGVPKNLLKRPMLSKLLNVFSSQDRRITFYLPASILPDNREGIITYFMDSVSQKNYCLSLWKQFFQHTYIMTFTLNIIHIHIKVIPTHVHHVLTLNIIHMHIHNDNYPQVHSNTPTS